MTIKKVSLSEKFDRFQETSIADTKLLLLEPKTMVNTGTTGGERTAEPVWI